jgi:hypothetical protein
VVSGTCVASGRLVGELAEKVRGEARTAAERQAKQQQQQQQQQQRQQQQRGAAAGTPQPPGDCLPGNS